MGLKSVKCDWRIKKEGSDGRKTLHLRAYTPQNFSVLGVGADPLHPSLFKNISYAFELHPFVNRPNVLFYRNDGQRVIRAGGP